MRKVHSYLGCVSRVDHATGELLDWLEKNGLAQDTIVIYSGEIHEIGVTEFAWSKSIRKGNYRLVYYPRDMFPEEYLPAGLLSS